MKSINLKSHIENNAINTLNKNLPINITSLDKIISRVHLKYPNLSKIQINLIVRIFIDCLRLNLLKGERICLSGYISEMRLLSFYKIIDDKIIFGTKLQVSTPNKLR